jgi:hypothetical protein
VYKTLTKRVVVSYHIREPDDVPKVVELLRMSYERAKVSAERRKESTERRYSNDEHGQRSAQPLDQRQLDV